MTHFTFSRSRTLMPMALLAAVAMTCLQGAAFAGAAPMEAAPRTIEVTTAGLNLARSADVAVLDARIKRAARTVCEPADWRSLKQAAASARCEKVAISGAQAQRDVLVARAETQQMAARQQQSGLSS